MLRLGCALCALFSLVPGAARADGPTVARLSFERAEDAARCIDEPELRERVAARLGRDPFVAEAPLEARVRIEGGEGYRAVIELTRGEERTRRELASARADCSDLADALALALSLAVDPASLLAPPRPPEPDPAVAEPEPPIAEPPVSELPVAEPAPPPRDDDVSARLGAHLLGSWGVAPEVSGGLALSAGFRLMDFSIDLELRGEVPTEVAGTNGSVRGAPFTAGLAPCAHVDVVTLCGVVRAGVFWAEAVEAASARAGFAPYLSLGVRGGVEVPLASAVSLSVLGELGAPLLGAELLLGSERVWGTPPVSASVGLGVVGAIR